MDDQPQSPTKIQKPVYQKKPLNLGRQFINYSDPSLPVTLQNPLTAYPLILLFFGAEWCNISRPFMKTLKQFYEQMNLQTKRLEIIYISSDKNDRCSFIYPWIGIKNDDPRAADLRQYYDVRSIPSLVLLDSKGQQVFINCRDDVYHLNDDEIFIKWSKMKQQQDQETK